MFALHGFLELHRRDLPQGVSTLSFQNAMGGYWKLPTTFDYQRSNQPVKPTPPYRNAFSVFAMTPCRGLSLSRWAKQARFDV